MKILFGIQGTGNGHLSRARDVYPELCKYGDVDVLISGIQADVDVPFPVKYRHYGMSFIFGKQGGVDIYETLKKLRISKLINEINNCPVNEYDLVINDFEPISAWACKKKKKPCISLSHQCAVLHPNAPQPAKKDWVGKTVLKYYAPVTAQYGFHFKAFAENIFTPVIRQEIRQLKPQNKGHYTVYLPAYSDETIIMHLSKFPDVKWEVYSKHNKTPINNANISIQKIDNISFINSMASCAGLLCGAGFEGPAEAMYLKKKVLVVPMFAQYEQHCNAAGAAAMGATVIQTLDKKYYPSIRNWIDNGIIPNVNYPDITDKIIAKLMNEQANKMKK